MACVEVTPPAPNQSNKHVATGNQGNKKNKKNRKRRAQAEGDEDEGQERLSGKEVTIAQNRQKLDA